MYESADAVLAPGFNWINALWQEARKNSDLLVIDEIQKGLNESLTGRFQLIRAHHWNCIESQELIPMKLNQYLQVSILNTVIEKDILTNHKVKSPAFYYLNIQDEYNCEEREKAMLFVISFLAQSLCL